MIVGLDTFTDTRCPAVPENVGAMFCPGVVVDSVTDVPVAEAGTTTGAGSAGTS